MNRLRRAHQGSRWQNLVVQIVVKGHHLPGRWSRNAGVPIHNVHVGVQIRHEPTGLVPADAASGEWTIEVRVTSSDGGYDFAGPGVHGRPGERFLYLTWGDVSDVGRFSMFRRLKIMLADIDTSLIAVAQAGNQPIVISLDLTDDCGGPLCGRLHDLKAQLADSV